ncbi:SPOR domain-containing protein [Allopontixanthobacter sp.]|uniref:SPOR domain-containing protein n=1 Tax=Allopontixanthobacter sp. TaxID=2906452 RepID=UPI002ABC8792|nr:SPOR domain-containing protein [Allopontixanthobacter sp.]MDZ4306419.1 SPOR domain-containing protein [Allopontixanthobacter sp.]
MSGLEGNGREGDEPIETGARGGYSDHDVEELSLVDEDEPLPWLETSDYGEEDEGVDTGRIVGFVLIAALALIALFGAIWFFSNRETNGDIVADGSTIEAPPGPVKQRPEDPGGRNFAGTGDVAPAVSEGQTREGRIAEKIVPQPGVAPVTPESTKPVDVKTGAEASATSGGGVAVQVGAYSNKAGAETGWNALNRQTDALQGYKYRIVEGQADIGTVYRLQAMAGDAAAARSLCAALRADGLACQVK